MGLFDLIKPKKPTAPSPPDPQPNTYTRVIKVAGVTYNNDDGSSRQVILSKIANHKAPFNKRLDIAMEEYSFQGEPVISISVNGYVIGNVPRDKVDFLKKNTNRIAGMKDLYVGGGKCDEDTGERIPFYARVKIDIYSK